MGHFCWNPKHQTQEQIRLVEDDQANRSLHMLNPSNPMSDHEVAVLKLRNGQLAIHGLNGSLPTASTIKARWGSSCDTLESIVHQATCPQNINLLQHDPTPADMSSIPVATVSKKRTRSSSDRCKEIPSVGFQEDGSECGRASATFCRDDDDTTMVTWASHGSPRSMKAKTIAFVSQDGSESRYEDRETKSETGRSHATRPTRTSAIHNLSERRRRDRINQKMDALQKLVPNATKTDKASILDEVIEYLKQLQAQVEMMSMRSMAAQMMMMQQQQQHRQLQMSVLARMGVRMGIGMPDGIDSLACNPSPVIMPHFVAPQPVVPTHFPVAAQANSNGSSNGSVCLPDPYYASMAQSMNMELYNKMAAVYRPQMNQTTQTSSNPLRSNNVQQD